MIKHLLTVMALLMGTWLLVDGARALFTGHYTTPRTGPYAGQLGPWANGLRAVGIDPYHLAVRVAHVLIGFCWLLSAAALWAHAPQAQILLLSSAVLSLWYAPLGTIAGVVIALAWLARSIAG